MVNIIDTRPMMPYAEFPLFAHSVGQGARKIKGKMWYVGGWESPDAVGESISTE
jgi:hypothetical protein